VFDGIESLARDGGTNGTIAKTPTAALTIEKSSIVAQSVIPAIANSRFPDRKSTIPRIKPQIILGKPSIGKHQVTKPARPSAKDTIAFTPPVEVVPVEESGRG